MPNNSFATYLKEKGLSQSECARRLGVKHMTVWRWVKGKSNPSHFARISLKKKIGFSWPEEGGKNGAV